MGSKSLFTPNRSRPPSDKDGGHGWFSCRKNSCKSPSLVWQAINNLENSSMSCFRESNFCFGLEVAYGVVVPNTRILFFFMVSSIGLVLSNRRSRENASNLDFQVHFTSLTAYTAVAPAITFVLRAIRSSLSSSKGLPIVSITLTRDCTSFLKEA